MRITKVLLFLILLLFSNKVYALDINIQSKNAVLYNLTTNEILYEKNKDEKVSVASLQKIMTVIVAIEKIDDYSKKVIIKQDDFKDLDSDLAVIGFKDNEELTYDDLLYGTILKSGADAAYKLALSISGSEEEYVKLMNEKALKIGLRNTNFKNVIGLDQENQYSSANDMYILLKYALMNNKFKEVFTKSSYTTSDSMFSFNGPKVKAKKLDLNYFNGGKTGYTNNAGLCLASYSLFNSNAFILITLGAPSESKNQNYLDQKEIYDYFKNNYSNKLILKKNTYITDIKYYNKKIKIYSDKNVYLFLNNYITNDDIYIKYKGKTKVNRKTNFNNKVGTYYVMNNKKILYKKDIYLKKKKSKFNIFKLIK